MPLIINLSLVLLLIGCAGAGGYLLARAHFTATIANRVLAYQSRLARSQREVRQAHKDTARLIEEKAILVEDLARTRDRVQRYEIALFEGPASMEAEVRNASTEQLYQQANAYVQRVGGHDDLDRNSGQDTLERQRRGAEQMSRAIA